MHTHAMLAAIAALSATAAAQVFEVTLVAPEVVNPGGSWSVEVYAGWSDIDEHPDNGAALAGFALSIHGSPGATITGFAFNPGLMFQFPGEIDGNSLLDMGGGQLAEFLAPTGLMRANPLHLFTFDVTAEDGYLGDVTYSSAPHSTIDQTLAVYPNTTGSSSVNSSDPGAELILGSVTTTVIPAPAGLALIGLGSLAAARRRR